MNDESHQVLHPKINDIVGEKIPNIFTTGIQVAKEHVKPSNSHDINSTSVNYTNASNDIVDMCHFIQTDVIVTYKSGTDKDWTGLTSNLYKHAYNQCVLKRFPLNQCMNSLDASINDNSITIRPYQLIPLTDYEMNETREKYFSVPSQRDMFGSHTATINHSRNNPFNPLCDIDHASPFTRSAFPRKVVINGAINALNSITISFTLVEPLLLHPYFSASYANKNYARVENMNIDINWRNLKTMFSNLDVISEGGGKDLNFDSITFGPKLNLLYRTYTPNVPIQPVISNKFEHRYIIQRSLTVGKDAPQVLNIDQTTLSTVPENIYLYAIAKGTSQESGKSVESMLTITNVSFRMDLDSSALGTATEQQLFEMCKRNGFIGDWNGYSNWNGCALKISIPNGDIGGYIANSNRPFIFSCQVTFENNTYNSLERNNVAVRDYDVFMVCESQGNLILSPGAGSKIVGYSESSLMDAMSKQPLDYHSDNIYDHTGGSFKSFMKKVGKGIVHFGPKALRFGSNLLSANPETQSVGKVMGSIATGLGAGYGQGAHGGSLVVAGNGQGMLLNQTHNVSKVRRTTKKRL